MKLHIYTFFFPKSSSCPLISEAAAVKFYREDICSVLCAEFKFAGPSR